MTLPESTRLLRTGELPPPGTLVYVPENTPALAGCEPTHGWRTICATNSDNGTIAVRSRTGYTSWVLAHNLLVEDKEADTADALVSVRHEVTVTIQRPVTAGQLAAGAAAIDPDWPVIVNVHPDRIEIEAHHEEIRG